MSEVSIRAEVKRLERRIAEHDILLKRSQGGSQVSPWMRAVWETERTWLKYFKARLEELLEGQVSLDDVEEIHRGNTPNH